MSKSGFGIYHQAIMFDSYHSAKANKSSSCNDEHESKNSGRHTYESPKTPIPLTIVLWRGGAGEYISPEYIESVLITAPDIEQVWVTGQSDRNAAVAVVVPALESAAIARSFSGERQRFCDSPKGAELIRKQIAEASAAARLKVGSECGFQA